ncbi:MAG: hypothetical protein JWO31_70 [Phycisphaerales bacterium]|nr:hypothetical protein [Phycisphaerales bacterium]
MNAPRPYQRAFVDGLKARLADRPLGVAPTGSGKSFMGSLLVAELGLRTWWVTHRRELLDQAADELRGVGLDPGFIAAGRPYYPSRRLQVVAVDTVRRRPDVAPPELIVIDEAHHAPAGSFQRVVRRCPTTPIVGLTATPFRLDGKGLGDTFGAIVEAPREAELIALGYLVEPKAFCPPAGSLKGVHRSGGDYNKRELARAVDKAHLVGDLVETWRRHADGYLTIVFAVNVEHSRHIVERYRAAGVRAAHVDGDTDAAERRRVTADFAARRVTVMSNVGLFGEGYNVPAVECVQLARPTESLCFHKQSIGRATRPCAGKAYPVVLDHAGNLLRHGRITRHLEYSLDGGAKAPAETGVRLCPKCFRLSAAGRPRCVECGYAYGSLPREREMPRTLDGDLTEYQGDMFDAGPAEPTPAEAARADRRRLDAVWWQLVATAKAKRFLPNWVRMEFHRKTGEWRPAPDLSVGISNDLSDLFAETGAA